MTKNSEMEAKAAILDKCCQSVECLARGKVFDLVGTLDLPQSSSPETETVSSADPKTWLDLANEIEASSGLYCLQGRGTDGHQLGIRKTAEVIAALRSHAQSPGLRAEVIEECAKVLDEAAQDWNRIRDPGMANNARSYAKKIRALAASPDTSTGRPAPELNLGAYIDDATDDGR